MDKDEILEGGDEAVILKDLSDLLGLKGSTFNFTAIGGVL